MNIENIEQFLNQLYQLELANPGSVNQDCVYNNLCYYGVDRRYIEQYGSPKSAEQERAVVHDHLQKNTNSDLLFWGNNSCWLNVGIGQLNASIGFEKLYFNIDEEHLQLFCNDIFKFLSDHNIYHDSKIGSHARSDNVIIRLQKGDISGLNKLLNHINSSVNLRSCLGMVNPFIPTENGIGHMEDQGFSYNDQIAYLITIYLQAAKRKGYTHINAYDFICDVLNTDLTNLISDTNRQICDSDTISRIVKESLAKVAGINYNVGNDQEIIDALMVTARNRGVNQLVGALVSFLRFGDISKFSRYNNGDETYNYRLVIKNAGVDNVNECLNNLLRQNGYIPEHLGGREYIDAILSVLQSLSQSLK